MSSLVMSIGADRTAQAPLRCDMCGRLASGTEGNGAADGLTPDILPLAEPLDCDSARAETVACLRGDLYVGGLTHKQNPRSIQPKIDPTDRGSSLTIGGVSW